MSACIDFLSEYPNELEVLAVAARRHEPNTNPKNGINDDTLTNEYGIYMNYLDQINASHLRWLTHNTSTRET